jgi:hypothetical protein
MLSFRRCADGRSPRVSGRLVSLALSHVRAFHIFTMAAVLSVPVPFGSAAQSPYLRDGSIGTRKRIAIVNNWPQFRRIPVEEWEGKRVIFLPLPRGLQQCGYGNISGVVMKSVNPYPYAAGKIGKIVTIERGQPPKILIEVEETGSRFIGTASVGTHTLGGIAFLDEIDEARKELVGKALWILDSHLQTYDESSGTIGFLKVKRFSQVKVVGVVVGWNSDNPIRLIAKTEAGEEGFCDVSISNTNANPKLAGNNHIDAHFSMIDLKPLYPWPKRIWDSGERGLTGPNGAQ